jgi:hypothetical protein
VGGDDIEIGHADSSPCIAMANAPSLIAMADAPSLGGIIVLSTYLVVTLLIFNLLVPVGKDLYLFL